MPVEFVMYAITSNDWIVVKDKGESIVGVVNLVSVWLAFNLLGVFSSL